MPTRTLLDVSVITPAITSRLGPMLERCTLSVAGQSVRVREHLIGIDHARLGHGPILNELAYSSSSPWLMLCADDDYLFPRCIEHLVAKATADNLDVVYAYADLSDWPVGGAHRAVMNRPYAKGALQRGNFIAGSGVLVSRAAFLDVGGIDEDEARIHDADWRLWRAIELGGAAFGHVPKTLWHYTRHDHQLQALCDGRSNASIEETLWPS